MSDKKNQPVTKEIPKETTKMDNTAVATTTNTGVTRFEQFESMEQMLEYGAVVVRSGMSPMKKAEDVVVALLTGKDLGLKPMVALNNIFAINGKASIGVHAIAGLLLKAGVVFELDNDYTPLYKYADKSNNVYDAAMFKELGDSLQLVVAGTPKDLFDLKKVQVQLFQESFSFEFEKGKPIQVPNYKTKITFRRKIKLPDGNWHEVVVPMEYTLKEAADANLLLKDNWIGYPKVMLYNRCFAFGAKRIADDVLLGLPEITELLDMTDGVKYKVDEQGAVKNITIEAKEGTYTEVK